MKDDVLSAFCKGKVTDKRPSKETLNHSGLIYLASGIDPYENTQQAYIEAYRSLGIDILNRVPGKNVIKTLGEGQRISHGTDYVDAYLGLYNTSFRQRYPYREVEDLFKESAIQLAYEKLITPVPHRFDRRVIEEKMAIAGGCGLYYYMYYTTMFMWAVEFLGWDIFMLAAMEDMERFDDLFLEAAFANTLSAIHLLADLDSPFVFLHDDLADSRGPVFPPEWYEKYIFPRYRKLWAPIKKKGKKLIFVADGNMEHFLQPLKDTGVDGVMVENPATNLDAVLSVFGDGIVICGMETVLLTFGTPERIARHVDLIADMTRGIAGFAMCSPGGLHNNIPLENLAAYFDARVRHGFTREGWRKGEITQAEIIMEKTRKQVTMPGVD